MIEDSYAEVFRPVEHVADSRVLLSTRAVPVVEVLREAFFAPLTHALEINRMDEVSTACLRERPSTDEDSVIAFTLF